jgi:phage shock protein A
MSSGQQDLARRVAELERRVEDLARKHDQLVTVIRDLIQQLPRDKGPRGGGAGSVAARTNT